MQLLQLDGDDDVINGASLRDEIAPSLAAAAAAAAAPARSTHGSGRSRI